MPAAPKPENEQQRLSALLRCRTLDTEAERAFDDLTELAARLLDVPIAIVSLVDAERQWFKSIVGLPVSETPRSQAFCAYAILADEPLIIRDATKDERTADNPLVTGEPGIRFYAGIPLRVGSGELVGTLCTIDTTPREPTPEQIRDLESLARQAASQLDLRMKIHELEQANERANAATQAKTSFLANMSHEIRTPMTAILGYSDLLDAPETTPEEQSDYIETIRRNGKHLLTIIDDVLDLSKIEANAMTVELQEVDLGALLADLGSLLEIQARMKDLTWDVIVQGSVPQTILTDPTRLRQILTNLLANAFKFTDHGSVTLRIEGHADVVHFSVIDTGPGIDPEAAIRVFEPFTQADNSTTRRFGGTGLGLSICRSLATVLGGSLDLQSTLGSGSEFSLTLPAPAAGGPQLPEGSLCHSLVKPSKRTPPASTNPDLLAGLRVLLVEDGPDNQRLITHHLKRAGVSVTVANDGLEALSFLTQGGQPLSPAPVDLVLMDVQMPNLDGYETTRRLRGMGFDLPIVALTAHAMLHEKTACIEAGCSEFLTKPIRPDELLATLGTLAARGRDHKAA